MTTSQRRPRLNLGCGLSFRPGFINIDGEASPVADCRGPIVPLPYATGAVAAIVAEHVIEHLPFADARVFLGECRRVLRPGGTLEIETPDAAASCAAAAVARNPADRARALVWLLGTDDAGMAHRMLYYADHLRALLREAGFARIRAVQPERCSGLPSMRMQARAGAYVEAVAWRHDLRRQLWAVGPVRADRREAWDEDLAALTVPLDDVKAIRRIDHGDVAVAAALLRSAHRFSPAVAAIVGQALARRGRVGGGTPNGDTPIAAWRSLFAQPVFGIGQSRRLAAVAGEGPRVASPTASVPAATVVDAVAWRDVAVALRGVPFGAAHARCLAREFLARGIRAFALARPRQEIQRMLVAAVRLDVDRVLAWWNLARLTAGDRDRNISASFYAEALARSTPATVAALHHDVLATRPPRGPVLYADDR